MPRGKQTKPKKVSDARIELEEFAEKYETLSDIYSDPVDFLFSVLVDSGEKTELRVRVAEILVSYRFPRLKALENAPAGGPVLNFNVIAPVAPQEPTRLLERTG